MPAQLVAENLGNLEVGLNVFGSQNFLEVSLPLDIFDRCYKLLVVAQGIHVEVYHQYWDLLAILAVADAQRRIQGQVTPGADGDQDLLEYVYHDLHESVLLHWDESGNAAIN